MENPPSASNDEFHNFLSYENLPGILIPQKVCLDLLMSQEPKDVRTLATFYRHETLGATISAEPGATPGVSLAEALAFTPDMVRHPKDGRQEAALVPLNSLYLEFILKWPGCTEYLPLSTRHESNGSVWTAPRLAFEVARVVHDFYEFHSKYIDRRSPANDWSPDCIPFDKLYLLELRQVSARVLQPVLYYDADYDAPDVER